ncbi:MAG TPA: hypothetical protein VMD56_08340 [Steroidobacteraceae bacterium]|nr:hypothetical protein [Steroidobacteraceae bacterium]
MIGLGVVGPVRGARGACRARAVRRGRAALAGAAVAGAVVDGTVVFGAEGVGVVPEGGAADDGRDGCVNAPGDCGAVGAAGDAC